MKNGSPRTIRCRFSGQFFVLAVVMIVLLGCSGPMLAPQVQVTREALAASSLVGDSPAGPAGTAGDSNQPAAPDAQRPALTSVQPRVQELDSTGPPRPQLPTAELVAPAGSAAGGSLDERDRPLDHTLNILLLGTDQRNLNYVGRTDTIMVLAIDRGTGRAALISFPRDIYLPIPGVGYSRINSAFAYGETRQRGGGIPLLISTIEKNFDIPIHNYVRVDFTGFEDAIDALGGIDITLDCPLSDKNFIRFFGIYTLEPGDYHMNGEQALYYARSRLTTNDYDRARRQQKVLMALRRRVLEGDLITRIPALWMALKDTVDTDLGLDQLITLARLGATIDVQDLRGMVLRPPLLSAWTTPQGAMVQVPDLPAIAQAIDRIWERKPLLETDQEEKLCP